MSNEAITWCSKLHPGPGPKAVLFCLADRGSDHSGEDWTCFPSVTDIVAFTDYHRGTVERHLKTLWREGYISRKRRRRADGKLGIYDYTLHRDADRRAQLKAARESVEDVDAAMETGDPPYVNLQHGPCCNLCGTMLQFDGQPCCKLQQQEPLIEPLNNPQTGAGAREPGDQGFEQAMAAWPETGRKRTRWPAARAAWARICCEVEAARMQAAVARCAADPDLAKGDFGWPAFDVWLNDERWRGFLPAPGLAGAEASPPRITFAGPDELRAAIVADPRLGEGFAGSFLDRCGWDGARRVATAATGTAAQRLARDAMQHFRAFDASVEAPASGGNT